jgi:hypothetical protein
MDFFIGEADDQKPYKKTASTSTVIFKDVKQDVKGC